MAEEAEVGQVAAEPHELKDAHRETAAAQLHVNERVLVALRQAAFVGLALLVAGFVTDRLRPEEVLDRGIASTPYLWAIVVWFVLLVLQALAFERPRTSVLERTPLIAAVGVSAVVFVVGLLRLQGGSIGPRMIYVFATSVGALMFWWGLFGIAALLQLRLNED